MTKFLSVLSFFILSLGVFNISYAACGTINLTCTQDLELSWTSTGQRPDSCEVQGGGFFGSDQCNSQSAPGSSNGWVRVPSANIPAGTSQYTFQGVPISGVPPQMVDICTVVKPTNCNPPAGTYAISASPNPVQVCSPATQGLSNIAWSAPAGQNVDVFVNGGLFASSVGPGSQSATWIVPGQSYVFTLRQQNSSTVQATVTVTGTSSGCGGTGGTGVCGDSQVQTPNSQGNNEQCDLGAQNGTSGGTCSATCQNVTPSGGSAWYSCRTPAGPPGTCTNEGTFASQSACQSATGRNCYSTNSCGGVCSSSGTGQYYTCNGTSCDPVPNSSQYATAQECSNAIGQQCRTTSNCDNICGGGSNPNTYRSCATGCAVQTGTCPSGQTCYATTQAGAQQCAQACGLQRYQCAGGCAPCGEPGQPVCGSVSYTTNSCNSMCDSSPNCGLTANPSSATVGQTVSLTLSKAGVSGFGSPAREWDECTVSGPASFSAVVPANQNPWVGQSNSLQSGANTFSANCNYTETFADPFGGDPIVSTQSVQCASVVVTGNANPICGNGVQDTGEQCDDNNTTNGDGCSATCQIENTCGNSVCSGGETCSTCPQDCGACATNDEAACIGNQATIISPSNARVTPGSSFTVFFRFQNIGNTMWTSPTYAVSTTAGTHSPWRTSFGTKVLNPTSIAGLPTFGSTNGYSHVFTAPSGVGSYNLSFVVTKNGSAFNNQCLVNGTGVVQVVNSECSDGIDNDGDTKIDCVSGNEDLGCFPDGNGGGGACNPNDDSEQDNIGANVSITTNPQLVRTGGRSNVRFICDAASWRVSGPQVGNISSSVARDTTSLGCTSANVFCGLQATPSDGTVFPALNIQNKELYTLECGGVSRSASISVIKVNEF